MANLLRTSVGHVVGCCIGLDIFSKVIIFTFALIQVLEINGNQLKGC